MKWMKRLPIKEGAYWTFIDGEISLHYVFLINVINPFYPSGVVVIDNEGDRHDAKGYSEYWLGPIDVPEPPKKV